MALQYIGNPDYRGYLNYLSQHGDSNAGTLLNFVGNNAVGGQGYDVLSPTLHDYNRKLYGNYLGATTGADQSGGGIGGSGSGGGGWGGAYNPDELSALDYQIGRTQSQLGNADTQLNQGLTGLTDSYNKEVSGADLQRSRALEDYATQRNATKTAKNQALGGVDTNARTLSDSVRRLLGLASGTGSSAFKLAAPMAVARTASANRGQVLGTYGANEANLATAENRATQDFQSLLDDLAAQRAQKESGLRAGVDQTNIGINQTLADLAAKRAALLGGGWQATQTAMQPYVSEIDARQTALNNLFDQFRTPYNVTPVNPQPVNLQDYTVDRAAINAGNQGGGNQNYQPYSYFLNKNRQDQSLLA